MTKLWKILIIVSIALQLVMFWFLSNHSDYNDFQYIQLEGDIREINAVLDNFEPRLEETERLLELSREIFGIIDNELKKQGMANQMFLNAFQTYDENFQNIQKYLNK